MGGGRETQIQADCLMNGDLSLLMADVFSKERIDLEIKFLIYFNHLF